MKFHAPTGRFVVSAEDVRACAASLRHALVMIRAVAGLPLDRYEREGRLTDADHAQIAVIQAAEDIGVDLGVRPICFNELDLRGAPQ